MNNCQIRGCRNLQTTCIDCGRVVDTKEFPGPKTRWISVKDRLPPCDSSNQIPFVLAFHTVHGTGVAWFWEFEEDEYPRKDLEEEFKDKYICSCHFVFNTKDGNSLIQDEDDIDIFEHSPHFRNLGTVTHWMPLPKPPEGL